MRSLRFRSRAGVLAVVLVPLALAGCTSTGSGSGSDDGAGSTLRNFLLYGGATVPPAAPVPAIEVADCPAVTVTEGGAAIRSGGESANVRSQLAITEVARECIGREDGAVIVKVGIQVRGLIGPGGSAARFDSPVNFALKRGDQVLVSRTRRVGVAIPPGQVDQTAVVVEDNMVVPPGTGEFDIEVGLGSAPRSAAPRGRTRTRG